MGAALFITRPGRVFGKRGWSANHFEALESDGKGTLVPTGHMKRSIFAQRFDEEKRRCTQIVADVFEQGGYPKLGEANAKLIAAAPDLLKALEDITSGLDESQDTMPLIKGEEVKAARAAIRKATK